MTSFNSIEELMEWVKESGHELGDLTISPPTDDIIVESAGTITTTTSNSTNGTIYVYSDASVTAPVNVPSVFGERPIDVIVKSLSEQPSYKVMPLSEGDDPYSANVWYVDDYESIEGACSTSKIKYKGSTLLMNVCESNGISKVNLILEIEGEIKHVPFRLEKACQSCEDHDMIVSA